MKEIALTHGAVAIIDDADYELIAKHKWQFDTRGGYAICTAVDEKGIRRKLRMHREILGLKTGDPRKGDHRDCNRLNNVRSNLRIATQLQNNRNRVMSKNNTSGFKGASFNANAKKWQVNINANGETHYFGIYDTPELANYVYKHAAKALHGEFANDGNGVSELTREAATVPLTDAQIDAVFQEHAPVWHDRNPEVCRTIARELLAASSNTLPRESEGAGTDVIGAIRNVIQSWDFYCENGKVDRNLVLFVQQMNRLRHIDACADDFHASDGRCPHCNAISHYVECPSCGRDDDRASDSGVVKGEADRG